ncbi:MAG: division/cell wall cluster transcriptional repressor MraZ [Eggerthellaceae bacterium]|nr:division/cell wall cluster transcriptional repressor MraZ [Eggerthellaceae bacterium]
MADESGGFRRRLDAKGRLSLPSYIRNTLPEDLKTLRVTVSPKGNCVYIFEPKKFETWIESLFERDGGYSSSKAEHVNARTVLFAQGLYVELDKSNRLGISPVQREKAGLEIESDVVVFDAADHIEVWDAKRWDEFYNSVNLANLIV